MTPEEYRETIRAIGWSSEELARRIGVSGKRAQRWKSGQYEPPAEIAAWLRKVAQAVAKHPPPQKPGQALPSRRQKAHFRAARPGRWSPRPA